MKTAPLSFVVTLAICLSIVPVMWAQEPAGNPLNEPLGEAGVIPVGADGQPLNLNFETGTLKDWTATGRAFEGQPIKGEIAEQPGRPFGEGKKSEHTGQWWIGGYEKLRDEPRGTLTSAAFEVTHPYASFLIGGGSHRQTRVELVTADDNRVFFTRSGKNEENLRPVIVDLSAQRGKRIFIRLVDEHTGGWGHINFDDFRFHAQRPRFAALSTDLPVPEKNELYPFAGLSAEEAAKAMVVPPGFKVQVAAAEPDVKQPIAMAIDDRGRIWIAEAYEYPRRAEGDKGRDRILIFEDTNLDGRLDKRTVFYEGLNLVSGLEVGFGGVWVGAAPYLLFIPDKDYDDVPDGEPVKLLDGWGYQDTHETLNSFIWGPDGWLYGCHGVFTHSRVGKPGTPDKDRVPINAGIWRYHPVRHEFEVFAHGTSNPWGLDYDQYGNFFATACVIPHIYHIIPGARYERQAGQHFNPYTYNDIKTIADHRHYTGNQWNDDNRRQSDTLGGGHAHAGCMIYQGGVWPEKYHGAVFMNNVHGNRINVDLLEPHGSGFVARHGPDFLLTRDQASQMLYLTYGPDGQVWVIDWYDMQQCHRPEVEAHDRTNGRIYRIVYDDAKPVRVDLRKLSNLELVKLLENGNEWYVRHARRILQERMPDGKIEATVRNTLQDAITGRQSNEGDSRLALRSAWALHSIGLPYVGPLDESVFPELRSWNMRLTPTERFRWGAGDQGGLYSITSLASRAETEESPAVRLAIAETLLRVPLEKRWSILEALASRAEDAADHNLPLMYWYAMEPLAEVDPKRALALGLATGEKIPILKEFMIRRIGAGDPERSLALLVEGLNDTKARDDGARLTYVRGLNEILKGRRNVKPPVGWQQARDELFRRDDGTEIKFQATILASHFGDEEAINSLAKMASTWWLAEARRKEAIAVLSRMQSPALLSSLLELMAERDYNPDRVSGRKTISPSLTGVLGDVLRALASYDDPRIPQAILEIYGEMLPAERRDALATLCSRPAFAAALLDAVAAGRIPAGHLTADLVTNLRNLNDEGLNKRIEQVWGIVRTSPAEKAKLIEDYKRLITSPVTLAGGTPAPQPDLELGRAVFAKTCQQCHTLFGAGGKVGPDITGSNRANLDYLLSNIIDPSAVMAKEYQPLVVRTLDGRVITGIQKEETADSLTLVTQNETIVLSKADIDEQKQSEKSMMPDDLLQPLSAHEVRSLVAYLAASGQTPMLATPDNIATFFNGQDLAGWVGDDTLWRVENGEIVGKSTGLAKNEFLISELSLSDFRLELDVKLVNDEGNSGIQFRSQPIADGEMKGYQADIGPGWWGKLYEEHGRALLEPKGGEQFVKKGDWNRYEIVAAGSRVRTWINGQLCVDRDDPEAARRGVIGLQLHSGGPMEIRFKNLKLSLLPSHVPAQPFPASKPAEGQTGKVSFKKVTLDRAFRSEGVAMGDFNNDGFLDIAAGSVWYENPGPAAASPALAPSPSPSPWRMHVLGEKPNSFDIKTYGDTFMNWAEDVDGDGRLDLIVVDFPGRQTWWFQNPGHASKEPWKKHVVVPVTNNESPQFVDLEGDGRRVLVYGDAANRLAIARPQANPLVEWKQTPISAPGDVVMRNFYHGLGIGDVNRNGRNDIVVPNGWWEAPKVEGTLRVPSDGTQSVPTTWEFHPAPFGQPQAQMYVYDFDGDGDNDIVGSSAHRRGIWWYEQTPEGWKEHLIDDSIAQTHALVLADINGDGLPDLVTGKRYYAHNGRDPGEDEPPELAWYELSREDGRPKWTKHLIDDDSGVGTQFEVHDISGDGLLDIVIANKHGVYYFEQVRD